MLSGIYGENLSNYTVTILVGGIPTPLKNMKVSWDNYSHSKPPTSIVRLGKLKQLTHFTLKAMCKNRTGVIQHPADLFQGILVMYPLVN